MENSSIIPWWFNKEIMPPSNKQSYKPRNTQKKQHVPSLCYGNESESGKRKAISTSAGPLKKRAIVNGQYINISYASTKTTKSCADSNLKEFILRKTIGLLAPSIASSCISNAPCLNTSQTLHYQAKIWNMYKLCNPCLYPLPPRHTTAFGPFSSSAQIHLNNRAQNSILQNHAKTDPISEAFEDKDPDMNKVLASTEDKDHLSEIQCLIRENVEIFTATEQDTKAHFR